MLHVLGPFRREGGIERDFLAAHTQQLVLGSLAFMVVFLHWFDEADEGRRRHRPGEQETLHRVATRLPQPRRQSVFHPRLPPPLSFSLLH